MLIAKILLFILPLLLFVVGLIGNIYSDTKLPYYMEIEDEKQLENILAFQHFRGRWQSIERDHDLYVSERNSAMLNIDKDQEENMGLSVTLVDNAFEDLKIVRFRLPGFELVKNKNTMEFNFNTESYVYQDSLDVIEQKSIQKCLITAEGKFKNDIFLENIFLTERFMSEPNLLKMNIKSVGEDCKGNIKLTAWIDNTSDRVSIYILNWLLLYIHISSFLGHILTLRNIRQNHENVKKLSTALVASNFFQDAYLPIFYISYLFPKFGNLMPSTEIYILYSVTIFVSLVLWIRVKEAKFNNHYQQRFLLKYLNSTSFTILMGVAYIFIMMYWPLSYLLIFYNFCVLYFQVVENGNRFDQAENFVLYISMCVLPKYLFYIYFRGFKHNILNFRASLLLLTISVSFLIVSIGILWLQTRIKMQIQNTSKQKIKRHRYLVSRDSLSRPSSCQDFSSFEADPASFGMNKQSCSICYEDLNNTLSRTKGTNEDFEYVREVIKLSEESVIQTPCSHVFHTDCLFIWMQVKMVCPYCKAGLPSFDINDILDYNY